MDDIPSLPDELKENISESEKQQLVVPIDGIEKDYKENIYSEKLKLRALEVEAEYKELLISEIKQRLRIKRVVLIISISVMIFMGILLWHVYHYVWYWPFIAIISPYVIIAMFVVPIVSITTITVMLLIGAFRRFKDDDMDKIYSPALMAGAVKQSLGS